MYEAKKDNWSRNSRDRNIELNIHLATIGRVYQK